MLFRFFVIARTESSNMRSSSKRNTSHRSGFTLVELLVVIAIIGILVGLLLPAIQASRESARRASCTNRISQLILGVHEFETAHEYYPSGTVNPKGPIQNLPNGQHISWIVRILPHIEEAAVYGIIDTSLSAYHQKNDRARQKSIELLMCPSSAADDGPYSNYAACHHDAEAPIDTTNNGVFFLNSKITRDDIKDGATYTLFLGEKLVDNFDLGWISGTPSTLRNAGSPLSDRLCATSRASMPWIFSYAQDEATWTNQELNPETGEVTVGGAEAGGAPSNQSPGAEAKSAPANPPTGQPPAAGSDATKQATAAAASKNPELQPDKNGMLPHSLLGGNKASPLFVGGFGSCHNGGANLAFGDGSVRFMSNEVSASLMRRLANRADGQLVDSKELP